MSRAAQTRLRLEARYHFGHKLCPACACTMTPGVSVDQPSTMRTRGHDGQRGYRTHRFPYWVHVCKGCNAEQGRLTFAQWAVQLEARRDPRASNVRALTTLFSAYAC